MNIICRLVSKLCKCCADTGPSHTKPTELIALTPEFIESEHSAYVHSINRALADPKIRNIALSGNYGVGKSSILQRVAESHESSVIEISLSTLAPDSDVIDNEPESKRATTKTNRIQQEIVKQLLYREQPIKTPHSRFRRIERFSWKRELAIATLVSTLVALVFMLAGWTTKVATELQELIHLGPWAHPVVFALSFCGSLAVSALSHGRIHISQLSAGSATITLDAKSTSFFDQYLDEIVYFFEISKFDVVIFEDIDRFNDSRIFETLRSLNTLLNASSQIGRPIRFIYATRDSIFDQTTLKLEGRGTNKDSHSTEDPAQMEVVRANRTKFFDLVIPVVPFITHRSARNLAAQLLEKIDHDVDSSLIDLAGRYVADMRLLKNVRNEFVVFRDRILSGDGAKLNLSETELFAMMLYKSTHLADFEAVRIGESKLDELYEISRKLVSENVERSQHERRAAVNSLSYPDLITKQSSSLGARLIDFVERIARIGRIPKGQGHYIYMGEQISQNHLKTFEFWENFAKRPDKQTLEFRNNQMTLRFSKSDLSEEFGINFDFEYWNKEEREELKGSIENLDDDLVFLRSADMAQLIQRPEFRVEFKGSQQSLNDIARDLLGNRLAYQLIRNGYINRNFTLYTSTFHGDRVSPSAMNFIIHHVERDIMDEHFELIDHDVDAVVREVGKYALAEPALYNIDILDHLLNTNPDAADIMVRALAKLGESQKRFTQSYLNASDNQIQFIKRLSAASSRVLVYLVNEADLDEPSLMSLVNAALQSLAQNHNYQTNTAVSEFLLEHFAEIPALTTESLNDNMVDRIARVFSDSGIQVPALEPLSKPIQQAFVNRNLFEINQENLKIALESEDSLALDIPRESNERLYHYLIRHLDQYLNAVEGYSCTVDLRENFGPIIEDIWETDSENLDEVIKNASTECFIDNLEETSIGIWPELAKYRKFPATLKNVIDYISQIGSLDDHLAKVLISDEAISLSKSGEENDKIQLARTILNAHERLPLASLRVKLVKSLQLENHLAANEVSAENGELFPQLLKSDLINDDAIAYAHLLDTDWPTRERFIQESKNFKAFMIPAHVSPDLAELMSSKLVDPAIKQKVLDQAEEYIELADEEGLNQLAQYAVENGYQLSLNVMEKLSNSGVSPDHLIALLEPHLESIDFALLLKILQSLGGDYSRLSCTGPERPRIPDTKSHRALLEKLKRQNIVASFRADQGLIMVSKRKR